MLTSRGANWLEIPMRPKFNVFRQKWPKNNRESGQLTTKRPRLNVEPCLTKRRGSKILWFLRWDWAAMRWSSPPTWIQSTVTIIDSVKININSRISIRVTILMRSCWTRTRTSTIYIDSGRTISHNSKQVTRRQKTTGRCPNRNWDCHRIRRFLTAIRTRSSSISRRGPSCTRIWMSSSTTMTTLSRSCMYKMTMLTSSIRLVASPYKASYL